MSWNDRGIESDTQGHTFAASGMSVVVPTMCWCSVSNYVCGHVPLVGLPLSTAQCTSCDRLAQACSHVVPHSSSNSIREIRYLSTWIWKCVWLHVHDSGIGCCLFANWKWHEPPDIPAWHNSLVYTIHVFTWEQLYVLHLHCELVVGGCGLLLWQTRVVVCPSGRMTDTFTVSSQVSLSKVYIVLSGFVH